MRLKSLVLASIVPAVLAVTPRVTEAQRTHVRCRDASACIVDDDIARNARERAVRIRERALDRARFAREEARARARVRAEERRDRARELRETRRYDRPGRNRIRW